MKRQLRLALRLHQGIIDMNYNIYNIYNSLTTQKHNMEYTCKCYTNKRFCRDMFTSCGLSQDFAGLAQNRVTAKNQV